ncbi:MAG: hypothetical protein ABI353_00885, partial [Isosphaeraceae bacterium]
MSLPDSTPFDTVAKDLMMAYRPDPRVQFPIGRCFLATDFCGIMLFHPDAMSGPNRVDWDFVHATVQDALAGLTAQV